MNPAQLAHCLSSKRSMPHRFFLGLFGLPKRTYHDIEQLLVEPKVAALGKCLKRGVKTIIFITYIKNTIRPITNWLSKNNYSYSIYTGDEKEAQDEGYLLMNLSEVILRFWLHPSNVLARVLMGFNLFVIVQSSSSCPGHQRNSSKPLGGWTKMALILTLSRCSCR